MIHTVKSHYLMSEKNLNLGPENGWEVIAQEIDALKDKKQEIEQEISIKQKILLELIQYKNCIGSGYYIEQIHRKGSIDYNAIDILKNVDLESYRKPSTSYWKIEKY